jgi:TPR repeat protein
MKIKIAKILLLVVLGFNCTACNNDNTTKKDYFKELKNFQKSFELNSGNGCSNLGVMYEHGKGVKQNNIEALEYYGKACDLKSQEGCKRYAKLKNDN